MCRSNQLAIMLACVIAFGCGLDTGDSEPVATQDHTKNHADGIELSINDSAGSQLPADGATLPKDSHSSPPDDVEVKLATIKKLRIAPLPDDLDDARIVRRKRNLQIVHLATDVLRLSINMDARSEQFAAGVSHLLEARFQLALNGADADISQLYADVQALNDRDPESVHAAEGIYFLAKFAHTKARLLGRSDPVWFENFSRWSREFADRFPDQAERAALLLFGAGRSCEMHSMVVDSVADAKRLRTESKLCYAALVEQFGDTDQAGEATAVLRRMALPGQRLSQFAGPTLDGAYLNADEFVDKVTVIYFWDGENPEFLKKLLPLLRQADEASSGQLRFVGVPLEQDESVLRAFLQNEQPPGQQIFHPDPAQRSWNSPLIKFWGISRSPSVWLIERDGGVAAVDIGGAHLVESMRRLFK